MFYSRLDQTAVRLINGAGCELTYKVHTGSAYDPDTRTKVLTYADHSVKGYIARLTKDEQEIPALVGRVASAILIAGNDLADLGVTPKEQDKIVTPTGTVNVNLIRQHWFKNGVAVWRLLATQA